MKTITAKIQYAHCIKWTTGKMDIEPFSAYELRSETVDVIEEISHEFDANEYTVRQLNGTIIGSGFSVHEAIASAQYRLMDDSRTNQQRLCRERLNK